MKLGTVMAIIFIAVVLGTCIWGICQLSEPINVNRTGVKEGLSLNDYKDVVMIGWRPWLHNDRIIEVSLKKGDSVWVENMKTVLLSGLKPGDSIIWLGKKKMGDIDIRIDSIGTWEITEPDPFVPLEEIPWPPPKDTLKNTDNILKTQLKNLQSAL